MVHVGEDPHRVAETREAVVVIGEVWLEGEHERMGHSVRGEVGI